MSLVLDLPLRGSQLIEASAGTGKTFTIALLYVRLVLGHGMPEDDEQPRDNGFGRLLTPPEILVVTFTEAATQELKGRIRQRLVEAADAFREDPETADLASGDPLLALRNEYPPAAWKTCARRLQMAAEWMDDAAVSTIHSWCYKMLVEHAFDSGNLFAQTLLSDQTEVIAEAVQDYWRTRFYPLSPALAAMVYEEFKSPDELRKAVKDLLKREEARLEFNEAPVDPRPLDVKLAEMGSRTQSARDAEQQARDAWLGDQEALRAQLWELRAGMNGNSFRGKDDDDTFAEWVEGVEAWAHGGPANDFLPRLGAQTMKLKKGHAVPDHPFYALVDAWQSTAALIPNLRPHLLADARDWVLEAIQRQLQSRAEMGFDDLLKRLDAALAGENGPALAQRIREQFPVAMIDEFQDTDPLQYRIFEQVYRVSANDEQTGIILIGDPKQAIYSFRGADIRTYLKAKQDTAERLYTLDRNFRSSDGMVKAVNALFAHAEQHPAGAFRFRAEGHDPLPFHPVKAKGREEVLVLQGQPAPALNAWWLAPDDKVRPKVYQKAMAEHAAEQLAQWLQQAREGQAGFRAGDTLTPLKPSDVAILVRDKNEAAVMREALSRRQLASAFLSDRDSVFASEEARDLLYWLQACASPDHDGHVRTALATPTLGLDLAWLDHLTSDELEWEAYQDRFHRYRQRWQTVGVLPMLRLMVHEFDLARRLLAETGGERRLTNVLHLAEWAQQASELLDGEQALIRELAEHINNPTGEEQVLRLESDAELIKVVTIHKSKGLEYPLVLLPFISHWNEVDGRRGRPTYDKDGLVIELGKKKDAPYAFSEADDERLSEDMRLLYVALTRARHAAFLGIAPLAPGNAKLPQLHKGSLGYLLAGGQPMKSAAELEDKAQEALGGCGEVAWSVVDEDVSCTVVPPSVDAATFQPARRPTHAAFAPWWISSYTAIVERGGATSSDLAPDTPAQATQADEASVSLGQASGTPAPGTIHAFARGPEAGNFLHGVLEWAGQKGFAQALEETTERRQMIERRCRVRGWEQEAEGLDEWLTTLLQTPLLAEAPGMAPVGLSRYLVEQDFWFGVHQVATPALDQLLQAHTLGGIRRPALAYNRLNGMLKGFIDLTVEHEGRYYVLDWKSNWLGPDAGHYHPAAMRQSMAEKRHDVQLALYLLALHRHLRQRLPDYDYDTHVGGALYVYLRGTGEPGRGVHHEKPSRELIEALDALFADATATAEEIA